MRKDIRIFALVMFLIVTNTNGTFYLLFNNNCEGKSITYLIGSICFILVFSFLFAWILQKAGVKFDMKSIEKAK